MNLCVIPARGGSKRIPRKNIRDFCGKPMIAWSIEAAAESGCFDRIVVSTDDSEISTIAMQYGAETPFLRPKNLADDLTPTIPVVGHAIEWFEESGHTPRFVCCLYATAAFTEPSDLRRGYSLLESTGSEYAFTATSYPFPIQRAVRITPEGRTEMFWPEHFNTRSQDLEEAWHDAGQFYWGHASAWKKGLKIFEKYAAAIPIPRHLVQDIDTEEDWVRAEWLKQLSMR
jgi:pseudaminic acid cytidylyltransferase